MVKIKELAKIETLHVMLTAGSIERCQTPCTTMTQKDNPMLKKRRMALLAG